MSELSWDAYLAVWGGIVLCIAHSALCSGLNLAVFSVSRLRLEVEASGGNANAAKLLALRRDANLILATILWANVGGNVLLTLLSGSVLAGVAAFVFSTVVITIVCEILPQAYFSRNALRTVHWFAPLLQSYRAVLFPIAKPTAMFLDWWLGPEAVPLLRERDFRPFFMKHVEGGTEVSRLEAIGALNFLALDDILVADEGELVDPLSVIELPFEGGRPVLPPFRSEPDDPFLRQLDASGKRWVIFTDRTGQPRMVLSAHHFLRDVLFEAAARLEPYCHRPIVITEMRTRLGDVIGRLRVQPEHPADDVIDNDLILVWGQERRIITGADLLGRLLRGIATLEPLPPQANSAAKRD